MEPHGPNPWYLYKNTLLRPWAPKRSRLREARCGGRRKVGSQALRLRRVIRQWRNPPKQRYLGSGLAPTPLTHSSTGRARACTPKCVTARRRGLLRRRIKTDVEFMTESLQVVFGEDRGCQKRPKLESGTGSREYIWPPAFPRGSLQIDPPPAQRGDADSLPTLHSLNPDPCRDNLRLPLPELLRFCCNQRNKVDHREKTGRCLELEFPGTS